MGVASTAGPHAARGPQQSFCGGAGGGLSWGGGFNRTCGGVGRGVGGGRSGSLWRWRRAPPAAAAAASHGLEPPAFNELPRFVGRSASAALAAAGAGLVPQCPESTTRCNCYVHCTKGPLLRMTHAFLCREGVQVVGPGPARGNGIFLNRNINLDCSNGLEAGAISVQHTVSASAEYMAILLLFNR